jgi:hypothetical protein
VGTKKCSTKASNTKALVEPSDLATHGGGRDFDAVLFLEGFAMLFEGQSGVVLELGRQPLFEQRALAGGRIRDRPGLHSSRLAPPFEPTLDGRQRHQKDLCYFLGKPRSTASSTFSLRSFDYALMPKTFSEDQSPIKSL